MESCSRGGVFHQAESDAGMLVRGQVVSASWWPRDIPSVAPMCPLHSGRLLSGHLRLLAVILYFQLIEQSVLANTNKPLFWWLSFNFIQCKLHCMQCRILADYYTSPRQRLVRHARCEILCHTLSYKNDINREPKKHVNKCGNLCRLSLIFRPFCYISQFKNGRKKD